jgi:hypothetical protein
VLTRAERRFACKRLKRSFCFNTPLHPLSHLAFIDSRFFELAFLDGFIN